VVAGTVTAAFGQVPRRAFARTSLAVTSPRRPVVPAV